MWIQEAAAKSLVENIKQAIKYKYPLTADVRESLEKLQTEVENLQLRLKDFSFDSVYGFSTPDEEYFIRALREILDEAMDAVDSTYLLRASSCHFRSRLRSYILPKSRDRISETREKVERICLEVNEFNVTRLSVAAVEFRKLPRLLKVQEIAKAESSLRAPQIKEDRVIGFDGAAREVKELLRRESTCLHVTSVVGIHGQGKTTLAKMVYNDPEVKNQYKIRAFVYVGEYDAKKVLVNILNSFTQSDDTVITRMSEEELKKYVYQQLEGKQYMVVLDNVYHVDGWERLKVAFPQNRENQCRVLITTRESIVARFACKRNLQYWLKFLSKGASRELLRWKVFGENDCPRELREYEEEIVHKCEGLPLAVVAAAAMLVKNHSVNGWKDVARSVEHFTSTLDINLLLYERLPNHLKSCFLYLATFPEDFEIPVWKLLRLWIAEGLIHNIGGSEDLEDIAEGYLDELVDQNLVMVSKRRSNGRIGTCQMNGIVYEICRDEAEREKLVPSGSFLDDQYRHICINNLDSLYSLFTKPIQGTGPRSLIFFSTEENMVAPEEVSFVPKTFKYLKVLVAESLNFARFPNKLCTLVLLKYLAISGRIRSLTATLFDLWHLQTLMVETTCDALEIKADVWKMPNFRHLHTNAAASFPCLTTKRLEIQDVENHVQTLCWISPGSCKRQVFDQTSKLKKLGIRGELSKLFEVNGVEASFVSYLHNFKCLENLKLWDDENLMNKLPSLPASGAFPKQLKKLTLWQTRLEWKEMHTLGEMENLEILKLKEYAFVGKQWKTENGGFLCLRHLHIGHTDLMVWETSADHFPILRSLEINGCDRLLRVPHSLADILSLQSVRLHSSTSPGVTYSLKRIRLIKFLQTKQADGRKIFEITVFPPQL